jgi:hypothetical protein
VLATEEYESFVKSCAEMALAIDIPNRLIAHAAILENNILKLSVEKVDVLTGSFPEFFFSQISGEFEKALARQVEIRIITMDGPPCPEVQQLRERFSNLKVFKLSEDIRGVVGKKIPHFMVSDRKRYRLEEFHEAKDFEKDPSIKATACFNNPTAAGALHTTFDRVIDIADPLN